jgi:hypothetical protein
MAALTDGDVSHIAPPAIVLLKVLLSIIPRLLQSRRIASTRNSFKFRHDLPINLECLLKLIQLDVLIGTVGLVNAARA